MNNFAANSEKCKDTNDLLKKIKYKCQLLQISNLK